MNTNRIERLEKAIRSKQPAGHDFKIIADPPNGGKYFVDGRQVSEQVFRSYPKEWPMQIKVTIADDTDK